MHPVEHLRARRIVDAWVDGELDPGAAERVDRHVHRCPRCHAAADAARRIKQSLRRRANRAPRPVAASRLRRFAENLHCD